MWTRKELKAKAKETMHLNYWKTVLVALVFTLVCSGAGAFGAASGGGSHAANSSQSSYESSYTMTTNEIDQMLEQVNEVDYSDIDNPPVDELMEITDSTAHADPVTEDVLIELPFYELSPREIFAVAGVAFVIGIVALAIALAVDAFLANPVEVGTARFFTRNLNQRAEVKEVAFGFDNNYRETVRTMFWRDVYTVLWGLLLIIPGIVKAYEYRMIPYLLADDPTMTKDEAFAQSKRMMMGNKWRAFVLDLSFIGWYLLAIPTLGLVTIFYASPYKKMTDAALYEELRYEQPQVPEGTQLPAPTPAVTPTSSVPVPPFAAADVPAPVWDDEVVSSDEVSTDPVVPDDSQA